MRKLFRPDPNQLNSDIEDEIINLTRLRVNLYLDLYSIQSRIHAADEKLDFLHEALENPLTLTPANHGAKPE
jgi:hypothetical protein